MPELSPELRDPRKSKHDIKKTLISSRMFSIASGFPAGSIGRQAAWMFLGGCATLTLVVGLSQPEMEEADPVLKLADSSIDEETSLLRNSNDGIE